MNGKKEIRNYVYELTVEPIEKNGKKMNVYGIRLNGENENTQVQDISCNQSAVEKLVSMCNQYQVSPCHLMDVIYDFLP